MATRRTRQAKASDGKYEKNQRCEACGADLGQLDDGEWAFGPKGEFLCLECSTKVLLEEPGGGALDYHAVTHLPEVGELAHAVACGDSDLEPLVDAAKAAIRKARGEMPSDPATGRAAGAER